MLNFIIYRLCERGYVLGYAMRLYHRDDQVYNCIKAGIVAVRCCPSGHCHDYNDL